MLAASRRAVRRLLTRGLPSRVAAAAGAAIVIVLGIAFSVFTPELSHAAEGLILLVPVTVAAATGGRRAGAIVAAVATLAFWLLVPPAGSLRVRFTEDVVAVVVFASVAFAVSAVLAHRIEVLGQLERQRAALLQSVSHDLRAPLQAIRTAVVELHDGTDYTPAARQRMLDLIDGETERLDRLVANLLSLARIESGRLRPRRAAVDVGELVRHSASRLPTVLAGTTVLLDVPADIPFIQADYTLLEQAVTNLIENAARHNPPGEPVEVAVSANGDHVEVVVMDSGPGVTPEEAGTIFEPFASGASPGANGLGLAISRAAVEAHGGTIAVSGSPRGGAAFTVTMPVR
jgi:two-component system sensor histidine kinase KdpD